MRTVVMITGRFRSGTSLVAQLCHRMGFPAGLWITPPAPPRWVSDWEDKRATEILLNHAPFGSAPRTNKAFGVDFQGYLAHRFMFAKKLAPVHGKPRGICCKSPLYALFIPEVEAAARAIGADVKWIECRREQETREWSLAETHGQMGVEHYAKVQRTDQMIAAALEGWKGDRLVIDRDSMVTNPDQLTVLESYIGANDLDAAVEAERLIQKG